MSLQPRSTYVDIDGNPVHLADYGGAADLPTVVCVHGLAGSHANWRAVAASLTPHCRVLAVDLPGHGRTPRHGRSAAVSANRLVLDRLLKDVIGEPVMLMGHSMGATLSILQAAAEPTTVSALTLIAPPVPRARVEVPTRLVASQIALCAWPWLGRRRLSRQLQRMGAAGFVQARLLRTCASLDTIDQLTLDLVVELVESRAAGEDAEAAFVEAARSMGLLVARGPSYRRALAGVTCPTLLLHGDSDRLLRHQALSRLVDLQPQWRVQLLQGVGHSPHLEAPQLTMELVLDHLRAAVIARCTPVVEDGSSLNALAAAAVGGSELPCAV
uniref:Biotin synthesis protein BioH n=1 Tax=uncultured Nocardioidaceae bacterium TaxID=253824 RepID=A0A6J4LL15_9ACTN|nr:MAG: Biotin synthesis protein BioH [uncultured Nocardioidaceae bacterium]